MSREEDKRLYESKQCLYKGHEISFSLLTDEEFIVSELTQCNDRETLSETENALLDTARIVDNLTDEKIELEGIENPFCYFDTVSKTIDEVKKERILSNTQSCVTWFKPFTDFIIDGEDLQTMKFPPMEWLIDDILPIGGVAMVSSKPKMGKTFLALQMAIAVASGKTFLGFQGHEHEVLYVDLESDGNDMQTRIFMMSETIPSNFHLQTIPRQENPFSYGRVGSGFEKQIELAMKRHPQIKLVVVDVYGKIQGGRVANKTIYNQDYEEIAKLNSWAFKIGITLLLIHHNNKGADFDNPMLGISGSTGVTGGLQAFFVLSKRTHDDTMTKLSISGKVIKERDIFIQPESDNNRTWQPTEIEERPSRKRTVNQSPVTMAIRELMGDSDTLDVSSKELATRANMTPREVGSWLAQYRGELEKEQGLTFARSRGSSGTAYTFSAL